MTQASRPQADNIANYPTSDAGPYSADQWAELFQVLFTGDQEATQGPLLRYLNELEVTTAAGDITVDTGAGFCYGHWFVSSATVTFSPTHVAREDRVVLVNNNTNATYNTNLEFPTVLTDYNLTASIEPYSCRLAILTGTGPGAPRPLVNAGGINMVQLAHYDIDGVGAVTNLTDDRDFARYSHLADYMKVDETVLGAPAATITFNGIPQFYRHLTITGQVRSASVAPGGGDIIELQFNADAGNNYDRITSQETHVNTLVTAEGVGVAAIYVANVADATGPANSADGFTIEIPNYAATTFHKTLHAYGSFKPLNAGGSIENMQFSGWWRNTAAITRIDLTLGTASNFVTGTTVTLYGRR